MVRTMLLFALLASGCAPEIGSARRPVRLQVVPAEPGPEAAAHAAALAATLQGATGLSFTAQVPEHYVDLVAAMGEERADVAFMNTLSYLLAQEESGARAVLAVERGDGRRAYRGAVVGRPGTALADLGGTTVAYVDLYSVSGYVLPAVLLQGRGIHPAKLVEAGSHEAVVREVYTGEVAGGFTYEDAPARLSTVLPDVTRRVVALAVTEEVPYEPVVVRAGLPPEITAQVVDALVALPDSEQGRHVLADLADISALRPVSDADYDPVREALKGLGKQIDEMVPGGGLLELQERLPSEPIPPLGGG